MKCIMAAMTLGLCALAMASGNTNEMMEVTVDESTTTTEEPYETIMDETDGYEMHVSDEYDIHNMTDADHEAWADEWGALPEMIVNPNVSLVTPPVWPHLHPQHQHFSNLHMWSTMLHNATLKTNLSTSTDFVHDITKDFLGNVSMTELPGMRKRRSSSALRTFESDLLNAFLKYSGIKQSALYNCVDDIYHTAKDIYALAKARSVSMSRVMDVVKEAVNTILACLQYAAEHSSFFGQMYSTVSSVMHDIAHASDIIKDCSKVYYAIRSRKISWWNLGKDIATCYKEVVARARQTRSVAPVEGWTCDPSWYQDSNVCDTGCGIVDPDCLAPHSLHVVTKPDHIAAPHAPVSWICPPTFYAAGDGCDVDCGAPDPDCNDTISDATAQQENYGFNDDTSGDDTSGDDDTSNPAAGSLDEFDNYSQATWGTDGADGIEDESTEQALDDWDAQWGVHRRRRSSDTSSHQWSASSLFGVEHGRLANELSSGKTLSEACDAHFEKEDPQGGRNLAAAGSGSGNGNSNGSSSSNTGPVIALAALLAIACFVIAYLVVRVKRAEKNPAKYLTKDIINPYSSA